MLIRYNLEIVGNSLIFNVFQISVIAGYKIPTIENLGATLVSILINKF